MPPPVLCPVDFSEPARTALRYAKAIADHLSARLLVIAVDDPLLARAAESAGLVSLAEETERELRRFVDDTIPNTGASAAALDTEVRVGKPAPGILRAAMANNAGLIVMSSHGRSGISKQFFGSTTERVLRDTTIPVLVTPKVTPPVAAVSEITRYVRNVLVPVDLTPASAHQVESAARIANNIGASLILVHALEPIYIPPRVRIAIPGTDATRRSEAETELRQLAEPVGTSKPIDVIVVTGDASEEIVKLADARGTGLIVMGLHSSGVLGPRMGSVTYRVLCLTRSFVLALPPA